MQGDNRTAAEPQRTVNLDSVLRGAETADNEELEKIVRENGKKFLGALLLALLAVWIWHRYQDRKVEAGAEASRRFASAQSLFEEVILADGESNPDRVRAFEDSLRSLESTFKGTSYGKQLAPLYLALQSFKAHNWGAVREQLQTFGPEKYINSKNASPLTGESALSELAALVYARAQLAEDRTKGRDSLGKLSQNSKLVAAEAALLLLQDSQGDTEHAAAVANLRSVLTQHPEFNKVLRPALTELGIKLGE